MKPFQFSAIAWGDAYVDLLLNVSLPTQLSAGNLPAVPVGSGSLFRIYTTDAYLDRIRSSPAFQRVASLMPTRLTRIESSGEPQPHQVLTQCHRHSLREAAEAGGYAVFVSPDGVYADGAHARLVELAQAGKQVVMVASIRMSLESFVPDFQRRFAADELAAVNVRPRQLVRMTLDHLHHISRELVWPPTSKWPSHLYWMVGDEGILARCFHVHPMMVAPPSGSVAFDSTIDGDYVWKAFPNLKNVYVVRDSDELCVGEISRNAYDIKSGTLPLSSEQIAIWSSTRANPLHIAMFRQPFRYHACHPSAAWLRVEREAAQSVQHAVMLDVVAPLRRLAEAVCSSPAEAAQFLNDKLEWLLAGRLDELVTELERRVAAAAPPPEVRPQLMAAIDYYHRHRPHLRFADYLPTTSSSGTQARLAKAS